MLEVMLWLVIHNLFVGIFTAINLAGALGSAGGSTLLINETLSIGIMLVLVLMFLLVPIVTHLLLDRSYEGIGSFVGPQAVLFGKKLFSEAVVRPVTTGELPMGMGELKFGSVTRDIGQGRRVYRKKQVRFGPFSLTSLVWKRKNRKTAGSKEAEKQEDEGTETKTPRRRSASSSGRRTTAKKPRSAAATRKVATRKSALPEEPEASDPQKPAEAAPPRPRSRKKKESS
jgi:hypothetical protein